MIKMVHREQWSENGGKNEKNMVILNQKVSMLREPRLAASVNSIFSNTIMALSSIGSSAL